MKKFFIKIKNAVIRRKLASFFIAAVLIGGGYYAYGRITAPSMETRYVLGAAEKGTLVVSVTGSGQVSALNQVDVKPKISGDVIYVGAKNGDSVSAGTTLAILDTKDAKQAVSDAQINLDQTNLDLQKMEGLMTDSGSIRGNKEKAENDLAKAYEDGFNTVANTFLDMPGVMSGLQDTLYGTALGGNGQWNIDYYPNAIQNATGEAYPYEANRFRDAAKTAYDAARKAYDANFSNYKSTSRFSSTDRIDKLIDETYDTTQLIAEAVKNVNNLIQLYKDRLAENSVKTAAQADTYLSQLSGYTGKANSYLTSLLSIKTTIQNDKESVINVGFDLSDQKIKVAQAERALADARDNLANTSIRAPFAGTVAKVSAKKGDSISSGSIVATIMTKQKVANITLNEVDVAKIENGQKATLTFDAVSDITIAGEVSDVDSLGTASQGVVSYSVQIAFTTNDDRIKSGMTVSAAIVTDVKQNVLLLPNAAVKSQSDNYYVEILEGIKKSPENVGGQGIVSKTLPIQKTVEIGISNDAKTEIMSGLQEGELAVIRSISGTAAKTTAQQTSALGGVRIPGLTTGGGNTGR